MLDDEDEDDGRELELAELVAHPGMDQSQPRRTCADAMMDRTHRSILK